MAEESYTVIIRGGDSANGAPNRVSGNGTDAVYRVDWTSILPTKYQRFRLKSSFRSDINGNYLLGGDYIVYV